MAHGAKQHTEGDRHGREAAGTTSKVRKTNGSTRHQASLCPATEPPTAIAVRMSVGKTPRSRNPSRKASLGWAVSNSPIHFGGLDVLRVRKVWSPAATSSTMMMSSFLLEAPLSRAPVVSQNLSVVMSATEMAAPAMNVAELLRQFALVAREIALRTVRSSEHSDGSSSPLLSG